MGFSVEANLLFDKERELQVALAKLEEEIFEVSVANLLSGKRASVFTTKEKEDALSAFSGSVIKFMLPVSWGKVTDWGIDLKLPAGEIFYGSTYKDKTTEGVSEEIKKIRDNCGTENPEKVIENITLIVRHLI